MLLTEAKTFRVKSTFDNERGFTLIEVAAVVIIMALVAGVALSRFDSVSSMRMRSSVRKLITSWEFIHGQSQSSDSAFRLYLNLDDNSYYVMEEIKQARKVVREVDYLENLRTKGEQRRRREEKEEKRSVEEDYALVDASSRQGLDVLFYEYVFGDPYAPIQEVRPTDFPSMGKAEHLQDPLNVVSVKVRGEVVDSGEAWIRVAPRGASDFAIIFVEYEEQKITLANDPARGVFWVEDGHVDIEWKATGKYKKRDG